MSNKVLQIQMAIAEYENIHVQEAFRAINDGTICGVIEVTVPGGELQFEVEIWPFYPLQFHGHESIRFVNRDLKAHNHVNPDGSVCIHTRHSPELLRKLELDFNALRQWIDTYYLGNKRDEHYEHIFVPSAASRRDVFLFTDIPLEFKKGDYGSVTYSVLNSDGKSNGTRTRTYLIQDLKVGKSTFHCDWTKSYLAQQHGVGLFIFLEDAPIKDKKYAYEDWIDFASRFDQSFLKYLYNSSKAIKPQMASIPLMIGYNIPNRTAHWQVAWLRLADLPIEGVKNAMTKQWETRLLSMRIEWCETQNCSPRLFFGRGALHQKLTGAKILIVGIGAVGSMVATTLARGGCRWLTIVDHDTKEPGNVCRSEYAFVTGIGDKVSELRNRLCQISPFVEVAGSTFLSDAIKSLFENSETFFTRLGDWLGAFDIIIDCSTDNDLAYLFSRAVVHNATLLNISITNHAKELVCVTSPNAYEWMIDIFQRLESDTTDLFNPTGCWEPTFKASYNDIATLVQYAIKHINQTLVSGKALRNFYLATSEEGEFTIKTNPF